MNKILKTLTKLSFISLAAIPLLKENISSITIIICALFTIYFLFSKEKIQFQKKTIYLTIPFFMFLSYEVIFGNFSSKNILLHLPFLIFPLLFQFKPVFIDEKIKNISLNVFQISALLQCVIYFFVFINTHDLEKLFFVSNENIPLFREFVSTNYLFEIHPTYFSSFLLLSLAISLFKFKNNFLLNALNIISVLFFIVLFNSRIIIIAAVLTALFFIVNLVISKSIKRIYLVALTSIIAIALLFGGNIIYKRFNEIKTEINKPISGDYYNSTNTRVAIYSCSFSLLKEVPLFGFRDKLQEELNNCYAENYNSNFYKISTFNTHNHYINLVLYGGVIFLLLFLFYIFKVFKNINNSVLGYLIFFQILFINLTENFFSRHYGIVLFCYFVSLFIYFGTEKSSTTTKSI